MSNEKKTFGISALFNTPDEIIAAARKLLTNMRSAGGKRRCVRNSAAAPNPTARN